MQKLLRGAVVLATALTASAVAADRFEFILRNNEQRLPGGKICFFPGSTSSFARQFLLTNDVRCVPADELLTIPAGTWNIFATHDDGFVSTHPDFFIVPPAHYDRVDQTMITMVPARRIDVAEAKQSLRKGESLAIYITNEGRPRSTATVRPIANDETNVLLPVDIPLVPLIVASGTIAVAGEPFSVTTETVALPAFRRGAPTTVAVQLIVPPVWSAARIRGASPQLTLVDANRSRVSPDRALRGDGMWINSLVFFRNIAKGRASVVVDGSFWLPVEATLTVEARNAQLFEPPLTLVPAGRLAVAWKNDRLPAAAGMSRRTTCDQTETADEVQASEIRLIRCGGNPPQSVEGCAVIATVPVDDTPSGTATLDGIAPGEYIVELQHGPVRREARTKIVEFETSEASFELSRGTIHGRITKNGKPIGAHVSFGHVGTAVSDAVTGEYYAELKEPFRNVAVVVRPCDGALPVKFLASSPDDSSAALDIDIPENRVNVSVFDARTGKGIAEALITYGVATAENSVGAAFYDEARTDEKGEAVLESVGAGGLLEVCGDQTGYVRKCAPRFELASDEQKDVELRLTPVVARQGRVVSSSPIENGRLFFVVNPGIVVTHARVAPDGTFTYEWDESRSDVYMVLLSRGLPLFAARYSPPSAEEPLTITPPAMRRDITILKHSGSRPTPFTLAIDGLSVPRFLLDQHQLLRNRESRLEPGTPLIVTDVAAGPTEVIVGPEQAPPDFRSSGPFSDVFNTPGFAEALLRLVVPPSGTVTIP